MSDKIDPPASSPRKPDAAPLPAKSRTGFDPGSLKSGKGGAPKGPPPGGKRMALPGKARGR